MSLQHIWLILGLGKEKESGIFLFSKGKWCWTIVNPGGKKKLKNKATDLSVS